MKKRTNHTIECLAARLAWSEKVIDYLTKWPHFCRACKGWGGHVERWDPSPAGILLSSGQMEEFEPCTECTEQFICPRCGQHSFFEKMDDVEVGIDNFYEARCYNCGWTTTDGGLIEEPECMCGFDYQFLDVNLDDE